MCGLCYPLCSLLYYKPEAILAFFGSTSRCEAICCLGAQCPVLTQYPYAECITDLTARSSGFQTSLQLMTHSITRLLLLTFALWLPAGLSSVAMISIPTHSTVRFGHDRFRVEHYRQTSMAKTSARTIACVHHHALSVPWWLVRQRASPHSHTDPPALWTLLSAAGIVGAASAKAGISKRLLSDTTEEGEEGSVKAGEKKNVGVEDSVKGAMISFVKAYKKELSPLMPPACRFLPTCSVYSVEAIEQFGPAKGAVLTAWRLMRCNPFAGYGTDRPQWPPPGWFAGEKW